MDQARRERAQQMRQRREAMGMTITDLAREAGVNRGQISEYETGKHAPTEPWIRKLENALTRLETEMGMDEPQAPVMAPVPAPAEDQPRLLRITVEGVYGTKALVFEGSPEDGDALAQMVVGSVLRLEGVGSRSTACIGSPRSRTGWTPTRSSRRARRGAEARSDAAPGRRRAAQLQVSRLGRRASRVAGSSSGAVDGVDPSSGRRADRGAPHKKREAKEGTPAASHPGRPPWLEDSRRG